MSLLGSGYATYGGLVNSAADTYGIPRDIYTSLIQQESGFRADVYGFDGTGSYGLAQLLPSTARNLGVDRFDVSQNVYGGAELLAQNYARAGNWQDALSLYNSGHINSTAGQSYASNVLSRAKQLGGTLVSKAKDAISQAADFALHANPATAPFAFGADILGINPFGGGDECGTFDIICKLKKWLKEGHFFARFALVIIGTIFVFMALYFLARQAPEFKAAARAFS